MGRSLSLTSGQRAALDILVAALPPGTYLAGGTAIALRFGHRVSNDLDLFTSEDPQDVTEILAEIPDVSITSRGSGTLHLVVKGVPVSLIRYRYPLLDPLEPHDHSPVPLASLRDLICMKLSAIAARGALRDFLDLHEMLQRRHLALKDALNWYSDKFSRDDIGYVIRSLVYFDEADEEPFPRGFDEAGWRVLKEDLRLWVTALK